MDEPDWLKGIPAPWFEEIEAAFLCGFTAGVVVRTGLTMKTLSQPEAFDLYVESRALSQKAKEDRR